jgi:CBS-domain-containing membrane protein
MQEERPMQARDIMSPTVITISEQATIQEAAKKLADYRISGMPVVDGEQRVVGIVSEIDIINRPGPTIGAIMSRRVISVQEDTPMDTIAQLLTSNHIKRVPVLAGDRLLGIISRADIVRMMASRWVCQVCGAIHLGQMPLVCNDCGVEGVHMARELDPRTEITVR